uniref:Hsp90 chaperone protein kinase-targeting subunit n=1 Tax=Parascaris univalens TaxID=6257 RepID=A0A914ZYM4_PARUN
MPLDYSKWKKIEVSDDEDDTHPNIHTPSLFRWRHQARLERMAERKEEKEKLAEQKSSAEKRVQDIQEKLKVHGLDEKERMKLELEMNDLKRQEVEFLKKEKELEDKERLEPWNVDTIGHEAFSSSDDEMSTVAEQCIIIQYLLELSKTLRALATNTNVIRNFFRKFRCADPSYMVMFREEVEAFKDRLRKRGKDKRDAAVAEQEADEKAKRIAASPGGLDPQEVFDGLPQEMKEAFASKEVERLQAVAEKMDHEVFLYHLHRCIDSGLWIPDAKAAEGNISKPEVTMAE